jgi:nucleoside-diphosphate-sugar epimerase
MGLIGRWVVRELVDGSRSKTVHQVTVFDRQRGRVPRGVRLVLGDHRNLEALRAAMTGADAVLHLSALPDASDLSPAEVFHANVVGTFNVHEAARITGARRVVSFSSAQTLGWSGSNDRFLPEYLPIDEDHPLRATNAYGRAKAAGEDVARAFTERHGLETIAVRPVWTATPLDRVRLWREGGRRTVHWIHYAWVDVRDVAVAARLALDAPLAGHATVFLAADDSSVSIPLSELLPRLRPAVSPLAASLIGTRSTISNARAKALLGWAPRHTWRRTPTLGEQIAFRASQLAPQVARRIPRPIRKALRAAAAVVTGGPRRGA